MALKYADRVAETTTTTGIGTYSLAGAKAGFQTFVVGIGNSNTCYYTATNGTDWEVGLGTVTDADPDTLSRDSVLASSNAGAAVNWGAGSKDVFVVVPASRIVGGTAGSTDNAILRSDGTGENAIQGSSVTIDDSGNVTLPAGAVAISHSGSGALTIQQTAGLGYQFFLQNTGGPTFLHGAGTHIESDGVRNGALVTIVPQLPSISNAGSSMMRLGDVGAYNAKLAASSGEQAWLDMEVQVAQSGTAGYCGLLLDVIVESSLGSGDALLADFRHLGTSRLNVRSAGQVEISQATSGGTPSSNSFRIYGLDVAGTCEAYVKDEAGNETQISPHAMDGPAGLYDLTDSPPHVVKELNHYLGGVRYLNVSRAVYLLEELLKAIRNGRSLSQISTALNGKPEGAIDLYHVESFAAHNTRLGTELQKLDWDTVQDQLQAEYDTVRTDEIAAYAEWENRPENDRRPAPNVRPERNIRKPKPAWLAERGG